MDKHRAYEGHAAYPSNHVYTRYLAGTMEGEEVTVLPDSARKQEIAWCDVCGAERDVWIDGEGNIYYGQHEHFWAGVTFGEEPTT